MNRHLTLLILFLAILMTASAQDTIATHQILLTPCVRRVVIDTMPAKVFNDMRALDLKGKVSRVNSRTMDYLTYVVIDETFDLDDYGYILRSVRKSGNLNARNTTGMNDLGQVGSVEYSNVTTMNNVYQKGKIIRIEIADMERGDYTIHYRYDLCGNVMGHDTVYDGVHHRDYTARFDKYHNPSFIKDLTGTLNEYSIQYLYAADVYDVVLEKTVEKYNVITQASSTSLTKYTYNGLNQLSAEVTESDNGTVSIEYTYDAQGNVIGKKTNTGQHEFEELMERDSYGSVVNKKVLRDGKLIIQIYNKITYGSGDAIL